MIPDVEQGDKLFRYVSLRKKNFHHSMKIILYIQGSFGKCEFVRTNTQASSSIPLEIIPNDRKRYEKPYRLRALESTESNEQISDFEKDFLHEMNEKMFPSSLDEVRTRNHQECLDILHSSESLRLPETSIEALSSKLIISEHVYLLPEEVRNPSIHSLLHSISPLDHFPPTCSRLLNSPRCIHSTLS